MSERIGYMTTDSVHDDEAKGYGGDLVLVDPRDTQFIQRCDGLILDWDFLAPEHRERVLKQVLSRRVPCVVVVHSYGPNDDEAVELAMHGVAVFPRLDRELVRTVCQAIRRRGENSTR